MSSASSIFSFSFSIGTISDDAKPTIIPITTANSTATYPEAAVIPARPATAPLIAAITLDFRVRIQNITTQIRHDTADAICVFTIVIPERDPAAYALPALNPNHPSHKSDEPRTASGILCGTMMPGPNPSLLPRTSAAAIPPTPVVVCMIIPPAKSTTPSLCSHPSPQIQCTRG